MYKKDLTQSQDYSIETYTNPVMFSLFSNALPKEVQKQKYESIDIHVFIALGLLLDIS